ncbi:MAG: hypothetical protein O9972_12455 [Burkholderiales bacterium]|nr:hypothetical protein [Burkholderiales bacterium]
MGDGAGLPALTARAASAARQNRPGGPRAHDARPPPDPEPHEETPMDPSRSDTAPRASAAPRSPRRRLIVAAIPAAALAGAGTVRAQTRPAKRSA